MEATRFLVVAVAGLIVDLAVAWSAAHFLNMPLWLAAVAGFAVAAAFNYALHEVWTFREGARRLSAGRALRYGVALAATLSARIATVAMLDAKLAGTFALPVLVAGAGVSFCVNYLISKHFVFRPGTELEESAP